MPQRSETRAVPASDLGVLAHCRRTAAIAELMAQQLALPAGQKALLRDICLQHHQGAGLLAPKSMERLLDDVIGSTGALADQRAPGVPEGQAESCPTLISGILRLADAFDQSMEAQPIEGAGVVEILEHLRAGVPAGLWSDEALNALVESARPTPLGQPESWKVPVFPAAASRMLNLIRGEFTGLPQLVEAVSLDPATAGLVMQLANSALFGSRIRLSTLSQAILRLGFATTYRVVTAASLGPLFGSERLEGLWPHSLEVADLSQQLACQTRMVDPGEAHLAGLVHDVGRIALAALPLYDSPHFGGLVGLDCPAMYVEDLLLGTNHARIGASIAEQWRLPEAMASAIREHHRPEKAQSPLAHILYLAEYLSGAEEDLPSIIRLEAALRGAGLEWDGIREYRVSALGNWLAAA